MRNLRGGYCFKRVDLANAYKQIKLAPESQKRLAFSTHKGVVLQMRLPFGIKLASGYFQEIMEQLTRDMRGVAVYMYNILVSGNNAQEHLGNLRARFKHLNQKGLHCNMEKCIFAQQSVQFLGHTLSKDGVAKGSKVDAVLRMPPPTDVGTPRSFMGSVQFYTWFLPSYLSTITEPLHKLTRKGQQWKWGKEEKEAFERLKDLLCTNNALAH